MVQCATDRDKQPQPRQDTQPPLVAIPRDRNPAHILHHKIRSAPFRCPRVENPRHIWVIHQGQHLALHLETFNHLSAIHPEFDYFERDLAADWLQLLRQIYRREYSSVPFQRARWLCGRHAPPQ